MSCAFCFVTSQYHQFADASAAKRRIMPRPKIHNTPADRAAAYRKRLKERQHGDHTAELAILQETIQSAASNGWGLAMRCQSDDINTMLKKLTKEFHGHRKPTPFEI